MYFSNEISFGDIASIGALVIAIITMVIMIWQFNRNQKDGKKLTEIINSQQILAGLQLEELKNLTKPNVYFTMSYLDIQSSFLLISYILKNIGRKPALNISRLCILITTTLDRHISTENLVNESALHTDDPKTYSLKMDIPEIQNYFIYLRVYWNIEENSNMTEFREAFYITNYKMSSNPFNDCNINQKEKIIDYLKRNDLI